MLLFVTILIVMSMNTGDDNEVYLNTKLRNLLVKCENHTVNALFAKCPSIISDFVVPSFPYKSLSVLVLFDFLNLLPPGILPSVGDTYYLYLPSSVPHITLSVLLFLFN
ncbi:Vesicle-mediated ER to Golgi transport protein, variant 2 [Schistosoma haematobium]|uniref:Vesicle-mediated ER to Golgi transport protein, variant 2 n=1 Tax=Schistosoma haematobium TaxID=6185 RepID=A0A922S3W4_SCHHA|nr:Vesicle-mediated ER to Golgi transport protein, variant 2 [Schistosoma haematobium]KAH9592309.1 Vesicle-mediated ER to Golgi transport protein, variant 2 [Schistosoma haematobium]